MNSGLTILESIAEFISLLGVIGSIILWVARKEFTTLKEFNKAMEKISSRLDTDKEVGEHRMSELERQFERMQTTLENQPTRRDTDTIKDSQAIQTNEIGKLTVLVSQIDKRLDRMDV